MSIHLSKGIRRGLVCGAALLMVASTGAALQSGATTHASTTSAQITNQGNVLSNKFIAPNKLDTLPTGTNAHSTSTHLTQQHLSMRSVVTGVRQATAQHADKNAQHYLHFSPSGISIFPSGNVYVDGHYVGFVNNSDRISNALNHTKFGSINNPEPGIAYAIKIGNDNGKNISILIPNRYHNAYDNAVSHNDEVGLANRLRENHDQDDANIMLHGFNHGIQGRQFQHWVFYYVNQARKQNGLKPYVQNSRLQAIANERVVQANEAYRTQPKNAVKQQQFDGQDKASDDWVHGHEFHDTDTDDATSLDLSPFTVRDSSNAIGECAGDASLGNSNLTDMGQVYHMHADNVRELAKNSVINGMVDHDKSSHNGHRRSILSKNQHAIGVAVKGYQGHDGNTRFTFVFEVD